MRIYHKDLELARDALAAGFLNAGLVRVQDNGEEIYKIDEISRGDVSKTLYTIRLENLISEAQGVTNYQRFMNEVKRSLDDDSSQIEDLHPPHYITDKTAFVASKITAWLYSDTHGDMKKYKAVKDACKSLGVRFTYQAIQEYLMQDED